MAALQKELGDNLHSCCLYGSAVRGNFIEGVSDLNLLIVLKDSNSAAHEAIARALGSDTKIDPFVLGLPGFPRSVRAFAAKFASIRNHYLVLHGEDPLANITIDPALEKFLCEQALRNLRLRLAFAFITRARRQSYRSFVFHSITPLFLRLSEVARLDGHATPNDFASRIGLFEKVFGIDGAVLRDLLQLKENPADQSWDEPLWHGRIFSLLDTVMDWIEQNWPSNSTPFA